MGELILSMLLITVGGVVWAMRDNTSPTALWIWGWALVGCTLVLTRFSDEVAWAAGASHLLSPLLPGFMLAGALVYAERRCPHWLLPAALGLGAFRWGVASIGDPVLGDWVGALVEPAAYAYAAVLVVPAGRGPDASLAQKFLAPFIAANGVLEALAAAASLTSRALPDVSSTIWPPVALITLGLQVTSAGHRARRQRQALERATEAARQALADSEKRLSVLAEHSSDMIFEADTDGRITYVSPSVATVLGLTDEQVRQALPFSLTHPDDREYGHVEHARTLGSEEERELLLRAQHGDGSWRWIETNMRSFENADGERRIVGIGRDVTERQRQREQLERSHETLEQRVTDRTGELVEAVGKLEREVKIRKSIESQLRESRARYRAVSELSSDFAFGLRVEPSGAIEIEWMTDAFTRLTGYELAEIQSEGWRNFIGTDHWRAARAQLENALAGKPAEFEGWVNVRSGEQRYFHTRFTAERDGDGMVLVGASRDITGRRRAEDERRELEHHINEVQRLESLGVLAGGIAHDFNNLLSVILGNSALALSDLGEDSEAARRIHRIRAAAQHAAGLTEQMLTYAGRTPPALKAVDLGAVVRDTEDLLLASLDRKIGLELETYGPAPLAGDTTQLRQIVINLVTNAGEAIGDQQGSVRLRTGTLEVADDEELPVIGTADPAPGTYSVLEVSDTGAGMDEATQQRIFEPFYTKRHSGRGLGLAAVLGIVQGHAGHILLESTPGEGTTFRILFRAESPDTVDDPLPARHRVVPGRGRILLVDDEPLVLEVGAEFLKRAGFDVKTTTRGRDALDLLETEAPGIDGVVLDLVMPELDGLETLRVIRERHPDLPVILTSGYDEEHAAARSGDFGDVDFLRKPYEPEELIEKVAEALDQRPR